MPRPDAPSLAPHLAPRCGRRELLLATAAVLLAPSVRAEASYPERSISVVVPFPAGGASDVDARRLGSEMSRTLGQPVVIDNVTGAVGMLGVRKTLRSPADGYTLLYGSLQETVLMPIVSPNAGYQTDELQAIAMAGSTAAVVAVRPDFPADNMAQFVEHLKRNPGKLTYGTAGTGSFFHFVGETLKQRTQAFAVHIPYRGGPPVIADLLGGQIDIGITAAPNVVALVRQGRLKVLGVSSAQRVPALPEVAPFAETPTLKGLDMRIWGMFLAPKGVPAAVLQRLNQTINDAARVPAVVAQRIAGGSSNPEVLTPDQAQAFLLRERDAYRQAAGAMKFG